MISISSISIPFNISSLQLTHIEVTYLTARGIIFQLLQGINLLLVLTYDRERNLETIRKYIKTPTKNQLSSRLKKPYVSIHPSAKVQIDADKLMVQKQWDGFFALQTNLKKSNPAQLLSTYRGLWQVEQTFRIAKSSLKIRPVFHYSPARIKAHFLICYMSLSVMRYVEFELNQSNLHYTHDQLYRLLEQVKVTNILHTDNNLYTLLQDAPNDIHLIYAALKIPNSKKFSYQSMA